MSRMKLLHGIPYFNFNNMTAERIAYYELCAKDVQKGMYDVKVCLCTRSSICFISALRY